MGDEATNLPAELLLSPDAGSGRSLLAQLVDELDSERWTVFTVAVASISRSGNIPDLVDAMLAFTQRGGELTVIHGLSDSRNTQAGAMDLLSVFANEPTAAFYVCKGESRVFRPQTYLFENPRTKQALLIIGSSDWSAAGFGEGVGANVILRLDLDVAEHKQAFDAVHSFIERWRGLRLRMGQMYLPLQTASSSRTTHGPMAWQKRLAASDVQRQVGNPTGGIRLTQAGFVVGGERIDQTKYFRVALFGGLVWNELRPAPNRREGTTVEFDLTVLGTHWGVHRLEVSHKPSGEAGQGNYTTLLHWGPLSSRIHQANLVGNTLTMYGPVPGTVEPFFIEIT